MTGVAALAEPNLASAVALVLVQPSTPAPQDPGGRGEDFGKSSPVGFLVLLLFFIAVAFLIRSMTKHLKRVPASFDDPDAGAGGRPDAGPQDAKPNGKPDTA